MRRKSNDYFAEWLSRTLTERGIAGGEVARALNVNDSAVSRWRNGRASPGLESVMALATYLDVHPVALAVTAGLMDAGETGFAKLALPEDVRTRELVKDQIMNIRGLTTTEKRTLMRAYNETATDRRDSDRT